MELILFFFYFISHSLSGLVWNNYLLFYFFFFWLVLECFYVSVVGWMDGWTDGYTDEWVDGWLNLGTATQIIAHVQCFWVVTLLAVELKIRVFSPFSKLISFFPKFSFQYSKSLFKLEIKLIYTQTRGKERERHLFLMRWNIKVNCLPHGKSLSQTSLQCFPFAIASN